jgi:hypothetical protein
VRGGTIDLQLRNKLSGPQRILNIMLDHKLQGCPRKEIPRITLLALDLLISAQSNI